MIRRSRDDDAVFEMSLCLGDTVAFPKEDGAADYKVVQSLWSRGQVVLCDHVTADRTVWSRPGPNALLAAGAYKVTVDPIGRVKSARD